MKSHLGPHHSFVRHRSLIVALLVHAVILRAQMAPPSKPQVRPIQTPVAATALPSGMIAVLESRGRLLLLSPDSGRLTVLKDTLGRYTPIDLAAAHLGKEDALFVTMSWIQATGTSQFNPGLLVRYSLQGEELKSWVLGINILASITVDAGAQMAYLGDILTPRVQRLSIGPDGKSGPEFFANIPGAKQLGALALDAGQQRLFIADPAQGAIFLLDLPRKKSRKLVSGLGEPAALMYNSVDHKLYAADASLHCIWVVAADAPNPGAKVFSKDKGLHAPRGLAFDRGHTLWVADAGADAVFALTPSGQISRTLRH